MSSPFLPPRPNVYEIHSRALYLTIPVPLSLCMSLTAPPCSPDLHNGEAFISICIDDLHSLQSYLFGNIYAPTNMGGYMTKLNLLVTSPVPSHASPVHGYQILSLDFEKGFAGFVKCLGALVTQKVPSYGGVTYRSTLGKAGRTRTADNMAAGSELNISMSSSSGTSLVHVKGKLRPLNSLEATFASFVVSRPHKFLHQNKTTMAWSMWGDGWSSPTEGIMAVDLTACDVTGILEREFGSENFRKIFPEGMDKSKVKAILQPEYTLVDLHNTTLKLK